MIPPLLLVGHRATGKTTIATLLGSLWPSLEVIDLDAQIELAQGTSCANLVAQDEANFRHLESTLLQQLVHEPCDHPRLIVPGAGCLSLPPEAKVIWLWRQSWIASAKQERRRLRPELSWSQEVAWMQQTREPVWAAHAHVRYCLEPGTPQDYDTSALLTWCKLLTQTVPNAIAQKTWIVPTNLAHLERAQADVRTFGLAGLEIRSDFFDKPQALDVPCLGSLRTKDAAWVMENLAVFDMLDLDLELFDSDEERVQALLSELNDTPQCPPVMLSAHPEEDGVEHLDALLKTRQAMAMKFPGLSVGIKYAPPGRGREHVERQSRAIAAQRALDPSLSITYLPQNPAFAWLRPSLATSGGNATNYLGAGRLSGRYDSTEQAAVTPWDIQDWLPHLAGPTPCRFEALVGDPVAKSHGDRLHRGLALGQEGGKSSYLKIPIPRTEDQEEFAAALDFVASFGVEELSVTSPHKMRAAALLGQEQAVNTLKRRQNHWVGCDTDEVGMLATLQRLQELGHLGGEVILFGQGGVSAAVLRALKQHPEWVLTHHLSARAGWPASPPLGRTQMIINAAGSWPSVHQNPPLSTIWVDLHYSDVTPPEGVTFHINGACFFQAQAKAQRHFWATKL